MTRQRAIERLHPEFVNRLAAIAEARGAGLPSAGIFSAYRTPAFGVGGFADKFRSLHTYALAVDVTGIGGPGTPSSLLWHEIGFAQTIKPMEASASTSLLFSIFSNSIYLIPM